MRFVTYNTGSDGERVGLLEDDTVYGLALGVDLLGLLGDDGERLYRAGESARQDPHEVIPLARARLRPPISRPPSIRDFIAFEQHVEGVAKLAGADGVSEVWYQQPLFYFTNPHAVLGPDDPVPIPPGCAEFDFELEVAAVIGRSGRNLTPDEAERHIAGYMIMNDWSARDLQFHEMRFGLGPAKGKDGAITLGPALVTPDELAPFRAGTAFDLGMRVLINGELFGEDRVNNMAWSFGELIAYASRGTWVRPGDIIGSGTCGGGCLAEKWGRDGTRQPTLSPGDEVTMAIDGLGTIRNVVTVASDLFHALPTRIRSATTPTG
jgi:2-keto-4-pentenoate hydratase/2-oxohepta-3-ene-1,7-dioic acid hydratase in catechol pathway